MLQLGHPPGEAEIQVRTAPFRGSEIIVVECCKTNQPFIVVVLQD